MRRLIILEYHLEADNGFWNIYYEGGFIMLIAHINEEKNEQALDDHLFNVAAYCKEIGESIKLPNFMLLIGLLHDVGKSDQRFQDYIRKKKKGRVNHSSAGGKYVHEVLASYNSSVENRVMCETMEYIIYSHHGLFDVVNKDNGSYVMKKRLEYDKDESYSYHNEVLPFIEKLEERLFQQTNRTIKDIHEDAVIEFEKVFKKLRKMCAETKDRNNAIAYYMHCMVRLGLSILKEGDIYDSATVFDKKPTQRVTKSERNQLWNKGVEKVESLAAKFAENKTNSQLNTNRTNLSNQLQEASLSGRRGIFKLEMPTGSGKTHASLRYAINNAKSFHKQRIFYITAFLSVLEQNAETIKDTLSAPEQILEHHSNVIQEENEEGTVTQEKIDNVKKQQYLIDSWDSPFILTTMVQFFNTMFKGKASNLRRFHQLIDSVIIIDEVQSLPVKVIYHFNLMMNFMSEIMNANIVLCTATQPKLDLADLDYPIRYTDTIKGTGDLAIIDDKMKADFKRTKAVNLIEDNTPLTTEELGNNIQKDIEKYNSILIILNTKNAVKSLYQHLREVTSAEVVYLTTNLCAAHRLDKIEEIRNELKVINTPKKLAESEKLIVVSTQLVEAGVDFDFNVVYRSLAGIDSLIQAAGRCNRNGHLDFGLVKIFLYQEENLSKLKEISEARNASLLALKKESVHKRNQSFNLEDLQEVYYIKYFANQTDLMGYNIKDSRLIDLLGINQTDRGNHKYVKREKILAQAFSKAAQEFNLIDQKVTTIIVPYLAKKTKINVEAKINVEEEIKHLYQAIEDYDYNNVKRIIKLLQAYTVQVYDTDKVRDYVETLQDDSIYLLLPEYYDEEIGLNVEELQLLLQ